MPRHCLAGPAMLTKTVCGVVTAGMVRRLVELGDGQVKGGDKGGICVSSFTQECIQQLGRTQDAPAGRLMKNNCVGIGSADITGLL